MKIEIDENNGTVIIDNGMQYIELDISEAPQIARAIIEKTVDCRLKKIREEEGFIGGKL